MDFCESILQSDLYQDTANEILCVIFTYFQLPNPDIKGVGGYTEKPCEINLVLSFANF